MRSIPPIELWVLPTDCDRSGRVGHEAFVGLFDRARWEALAHSPGVDVFDQLHIWPVVRTASAEYHEAAPAGTHLRFETTVSHLGTTSCTLRQTARRTADLALVAEVEVVLVCLGEDGRPTAVPLEIAAASGARPSARLGGVQHLMVNGVATAVEVHGDGDGLAVLFIHGFPLDRTVWRALVAPLTGRRRIVPDLRGFGLSDAPKDGCSVGGYADDMVALLDQLAVDRAVLCGLSMGGYIALDLVRRFPGRVGGLILMNTRADADGSEAKARRDDLIRLVEQNGTASLMDAMLPKLLAPNAAATMPGAVNHVRAMIGAVSPSGAVCALRAMRERPDSTPFLPRIAVPTLVVAGRDDQLMPVEQSRAMAERIPGAQFTVIPGSGHLAPVEQPVATTRVVSEFLESLS